MEIERTLHFFIIPIFIEIYIHTFDTISHLIRDWKCKASETACIIVKVVVMKFEINYIGFIRRHFMV